MADRDEATGRQKQFLLDLGCTEAPVGLTRAQASAWISELRDHQAIVATGAKATARADLFTVPPGGSPSPSPAGGQAGDSPSRPGGGPAASASSSAAPSPAPQPAGAPAPLAAAAASVQEPPGFRTGTQVLAERQAEAELVVRSRESWERAAGLTAEQITILRDAGRFPKDARENEIRFGLAFAHRLGLDVFSGQVKYIRFEENGPMSPFIGIDGMAALANKTGQHDGWEMKTEVDKEGRPARCTVTVHRKDQKHPVVVALEYAEAVKYRKDGAVTRSWREGPKRMLEKATRAAALRAAFPETLSGVFETSEVAVEE
ncbi:MAG: recombinase RecT [Acidimicrobiales bacterium]|nr:recombinase RecT [Acidimicrobiales bacterium]